MMMMSNQPMKTFQPRKLSTITKLQMLQTKWKENIYNVCDSDIHTLGSFANAIESMRFTDVLLERSS